MKLTSKARGDRRAAGNFRRPTILDIPFLFDLFLDGSSSGSFTDKHLSAMGHVTLLLRLMREIVWTPHLQALRSTSVRDQIRFLIFLSEGQEAGFVRSKNRLRSEGLSEVTILTCAITPSRRGVGIGTEMLRQFLELQPDADRVVVFCNKYARRMQRCLKRLRFVRQAHHPPMECYVLARTSSRSPTPRETAHTHTARKSREEAQTV
jgi:hypothetical protein